MATGPVPGVIPPELLVPFSRSISGAVRSWKWEPTIWELADEILAVHPDYVPDAPKLGDRPGRPRPLPDWLALLPTLFDLPRLAATPSEVVDVPLALLGLARMDPELAAELRSAGATGQLERRLGFDIRTVLAPWARPGGRTTFAEILRVVSPGADGPAQVLHCAFSRDGTLLATTDHKGGVAVWDVARGTQAFVAESHGGAAVPSCSFSPTQDLLATAGSDATAQIWESRSGRLLQTLPHSGAVSRCPFSPNGRLLATADAAGFVSLWNPSSGERVDTLRGHSGAVRHCSFSHDGMLLVSGGQDGTTRIWNLAGGRDLGHSVLPGEGAVLHCVFDRDRIHVASAHDDGHLRVWRVATGELDLDVPVGLDYLVRCAFTPDCKLVAAVGPDAAAIWDVAARSERARLDGHVGGTWNCDFSPDGRLLATVGGDGMVRLWETVSGAPRAQLGPLAPELPSVAFSADGALLAAVSRGGDIAVWEQQEESRLAAVVPDSIAGADLLGVHGDATALANVIAAADTKPPLSIGLFGDWGSGKTFLIELIQKHVDRLALRARRSATGTPYCRHIRNITFNAWHYADANLWASLATHIFDELAREEESGDADAARRRLARLEEKLAAESDVARQLQRARLHAEHVRALKRLSAWTFGLAFGSTGRQALEEAQVARTGFSKAPALLRAQPRLLVLAAAGGLVVAAVVAVLLVAFGDMQGLQRALAVVGAWGAGLIASALTIAERISTWVKRAGGAARVQEASAAHLDADLDAADQRVRELSQELGDLASGRRLGRFAAERAAAGDYRAQLGLISRIHSDFERMSELLEDQATAAQQRFEADAATSEAPPRGDVLTRIRRAVAKRLRGRNSKTAEAQAEPSATGDSGFPLIDRIVLYIDDLDRCPPRRVVEVLEAVHLILALRLFVVVLAVDPRWLLRSLRLHYAEVVGSAADGSNPTAPVAVADSNEKAWRSTPLNYLDKIIQVPFALRPMGRAGAASLVLGLLPIEVAAADDGPLPAAPPPEPIQGDAAVSEASSYPGGRPEPVVVASPSLSPRQLALTEPERAFAVEVAAFLKTPRAVKKFTNLYRLVRARLDEDAGELDRLLDEHGDEVPEYKAVLLLLGTLIAFPEEASDFLAGLGDLDPRAVRDRRLWAEYVASQPEDLKRFLEKAMPLAPGRKATREPFRHWALELSRYSFETGQQVFARYHAVTVMDSD